MNWYESAIKVTASGAGDFIPGYPPRGVLHTTESSTALSAIATYRKNNSWPHFTVNWNGQVYQHISIAVAARTLKNLDGGVETNKAHCIQIEIVGFASKPLEHSPEQKNALKRLMRWIEANAGVKPEGPGRPFASGYGQDSLRFNKNDWKNVDSWVGHCHIPENCVTPNARVLMADLTWKRAGSLVPGDEIIAFDEEAQILQTQGNRVLTGRKYKTATVEKNIPFIGQAVNVITENSELTCTPGHPWLFWNYDKKQHGSWQWKLADQLEPGDQVAWFGYPWEIQEGRDVGWLAGMYDADGCLALNNKGGNYCMELSQRLSQSVAIDKAQIILKHYGIDTSVGINEKPSPLSKEPMQYCRIIGGRPAIMRALGMVRPDRFIRSNYRQLWEGLHFKKGSTVHFDTIISVEDAINQPMAGVQTSSGTYIVEGWPQHQTHWDPGLINLAELLPEGSIMPNIMPDFTPFNITNVVSALVDPVAGGAWVLDEAGHIYAFGGARYIDAPASHPDYWNLVGQKAAQLRPSENNLGFMVIDNFGNPYNYDG